MYHTKSFFSRLTGRRHPAARFTSKSFSAYSSDNISISKPPIVSTKKNSFARNAQEFLMHAERSKTSKPAKSTRTETKVNRSNLRKRRSLFSVQSRKRATRIARATRIVQARLSTLAPKAIRSTHKKHLKKKSKSSAVNSKAFHKKVSKKKFFKYASQIQELLQELIAINERFSYLDSYSEGKMLNNDLAENTAGVIGLSLNRLSQLELFRFQKFATFPFFRSYLASVYSSTEKSAKPVISNADFLSSNQVPIYQKRLFHYARSIAKDYSKALQDKFLLESSNCPSMKQVQIEKGSKLGKLLEEVQRVELGLKKIQHFQKLSMSVRLRKFLVPRVSRFCQQQENDKNRFANKKMIKKSKYFAFYRR